MRHLLMAPVPPTRTKAQPQVMQTQPQVKKPQVKQAQMKQVQHLRLQKRRLLMRRLIRALTGAGFLHLVADTRNTRPAQGGGNSMNAALGSDCCPACCSAVWAA